ncbi:Calx-beta domain-containing protein [Vibrio fluvialis]|uniref:Calx-beta domain-containing protein n=1 Tax=Vibrio fluvialis TaxID=676 RepID=UPI0032AEBDE2
MSITESVSVNEGDAASFTVSLSAAADTDVTVKLTTALGSAESDDIGAMTVTLADGTVVTANDDGSYTIPAGQTELKVSVATEEDSVYEGDETFSVSVEGVEGATGTDTGTATITDGGNGTGDTPDDDRPSVSITESVSVNEGDAASFTVSLSAAADTDVTVKLTTALGSAESDDIGAMTVTLADGTVVTANDDGSYTIPAGQTELKVSVATEEDSVYEGDETFSVSVEGVEGATGTDTGTATITDGGNGTGDTQMTIVKREHHRIGERERRRCGVVHREPKCGGGHRCDRETDDSTGSAESDDIGAMTVTLADGTVVTANDDGSYTIPAGQTELKVSVATEEDSVYEGDETFSVSVEGVEGATGTDTGTATITDGGNGTGDTPDDDRPSVSITESVSVNEGDAASFTVSLSAAADTDVTVKLTTALGSAESDDIGAMTVTLADGTVVTANDDGSYTIPAGQTELKVSVATEEDSVYEGDETFSVSVEGVEGATGTDTGTATITDGGNGTGDTPDDDRPSVSITESVSVNEGDAASFTVSLSAAADTDVTVKLTTALGGAESDDIGAMTVTLADGTVVTANDDGSYTIPAGQTELKVSVATEEDSVYEGDETFSVSVEGVEGATGTDTGTATITDGGNGTGDTPDDDRPSVSITESVSVNEGDAASFTVSLSAAADTDVTVKLTTALGSAESDDIGAMTVTLADGTVVTANDDGSYTIPAGQTELKVSVATEEDSVYEGDETFSVSVEGVEGATGTDTGTATITDGGNGTGDTPDDDRPSVSITESVSVNEGDAASFTVSLSAAADTDVTVKLTTALGSAESDDIGAMTVTLADGTVVTANDDGSYTIPAGQTELKVSVATEEDSVYEGDETFSVSVEGVEGATGTRHRYSDHHRRW